MVHESVLSHNVLVYSEDHVIHLDIVLIYSNFISRNNLNNSETNTESLQMLADRTA